MVFLICNFVLISCGSYQLPRLLPAGSGFQITNYQLQITNRKLQIEPSPLLCSRGWLGSGVITAFRPDSEFAVAARTGIHFHLTIAALVFRRRRFVSNRILGTNIVGHAAA